MVEHYSFTHLVVAVLSSELHPRAQEHTAAVGMDNLRRQAAMPRSMTRNKRTSAGIAALLLTGGAGAALFLHHAQLQRRKKRTARSV